MARTRRNSNCCDGWEHLMGRNKWVCGEDQNACRGDNYNTGGYTDSYNFPRKTGYIGEGTRLPMADDVPAMLSHGEFVQQKSAVDRYGLNFMERLNDGLVDPNRVMHLKRGGRVTKSNNRRNNVRRNKMRTRNTRRGAVNRKSNRFARGGRVQRFANGGYTNAANGGGTFRKIDYTGHIGMSGGAYNVWLRPGGDEGSDIVMYHCPNGSIDKLCERVEKTEGYAIPGGKFFNGST